MPWTSWVAVALCLGLLAALGLVLRRLYALQASLPGPRGRPDGDAPELPAGGERLDELLSLLAQLQGYGLEQRGDTAREDFAKAALDAACRLMKCSRGSVMLWDEPAGCLKIVAAKSPGAAAPERLFLKPGEGVAGKAFASGQAIVVSRPESDPRYLRPGEGDAEPFLSIPLMVGAKPAGVLNLHAGPGAESFTGTQAKFLGILAAEAGALLRHQELQEALRSSSEELVRTLARTVDSQDARARGHSDRARARARRLTAQLQVPDPGARHVEWAAVLHDIGNIGVDHALLRKAGKLLPSEYEAVKAHPVVAHRILAPVKALEPVARILLYHQEWYDGRGYPEGLKGEDIPLGARLVAVLDAWEAMRSPRPFRSALAREAAASELRRGAGTQFDPRVVEAFLQAEPEAADEPAPGSA